MNQAVCIGVAVHRLGVRPETLKRREVAGKLSCFKIIGEHRRITLIEIESIIAGHDTNANGVRDGSQPVSPKQTAIYARVSSHEQKTKDDLQRQIEAAQEYCKSKGSDPPQIFHDIGSGLNKRRPSLDRLCRAVERGEIDRIIVTYPDRTGWVQ